MQLKSTVNTKVILFRNWMLEHQQMDFPPQILSCKHFEAKLFSNNASCSCQQFDNRGIYFFEGQCNRPLNQLSWLSAHYLLTRGKINCFVNTNITEFVSAGVRGELVFIRRVVLALRLLLDIKVHSVQWHWRTLELVSTDVRGKLVFIQGAFFTGFQKLAAESLLDDILWKTYRSVYYFKTWMKGKIMHLIWQASIWGMFQVLFPVGFLTNWI